MKSAILCGLAVFVAQSGAQEPGKKDLERLQGTWVMVAREVDGKPVPDDKIKDTKLVIKDNKYITQVKGKNYETAFTLDPAKKPKAKKK